MHIRSYGRMGLVLRGKGKFTEAMQMFHKYLLGCEEIDDRVEIIFALINIAELVRSQGDYATAKSYYLKSLSLGYELGYTAIIARIKKDLGEVYHYIGDANKAYELFNESLSLLNKQVIRRCPLGIPQSGRAGIREGKLFKAEELFLIGLKLYIEIKQNTLSYIFLIFEGLAAVSTMLGDYLRAACLFAAQTGYLRK
jgi:tetratricopeptide (TPR) repeat protein